MIAKACMQVLTTGATLVLAGVDARSAGGEPLPSADPLQRWACVRAVEAAFGLHACAQHGALFPTGAYVQSKLPTERPEETLGHVRRWVVESQA